MILADTSIWIDHLRNDDPQLAYLLGLGHVATHVLIIGEIALGNLRQRSEVLALLQDLPRASLASDDEVLTLIDRHRLWGRGIGYVDAHLVASALLTPDTRLWTRDRRLAAVAERLDLHTTHFR